MTKAMETMVVGRKYGIDPLLKKTSAQSFLTGRWWPIHSVGPQGAISLEAAADAEQIYVF
jgi:hypothetical protein